MIQLTNYKIERCNNQYEILEDGKCIAQTVLVEDSALHAIHVMNGSIKNHWYEEIEGRVYLRIEDE